MLQLLPHSNRGLASQGKAEDQRNREAAGLKTLPRTAATQQKEYIASVHCILHNSAPFPGMCVLGGAHFGDSLRDPLCSSGFSSFQRWDLDHVVPFYLDSFLRTLEGMLHTLTLRLFALRIFYKVGND